MLRVLPSKARVLRLASLCWLQVQVECTTGTFGLTSCLSLSIRFLHFYVVGQTSKRWFTLCDFFFLRKLCCDPSGRKKSGLGISTYLCTTYSISVKKRNVGRLSWCWACLPCSLTTFPHQLTLFSPLVDLIEHTATRTRTAVIWLPTKPSARTIRVPARQLAGNGERMYVPNRNTGGGPYW